MRIVTLFCILISVSHGFGKNHNGNTSPFEAQDLGLNQREKFHVMTAALVTSIVPGGMGSGYYLYDRPDIGKKYLITQSLLGATTLGLALSCPKGRSKDLIDPQCERSTQTALNVSFGLFLSIWIWQIFDVVANGKKYLDQPPITFQLDLHKDQTLLVGVNFRF